MSLSKRLREAGADRSPMAEWKSAEEWRRDRPDIRPIRPDRDVLVAVRPPRRGEVPGQLTMFEFD